MENIDSPKIVDCTKGAIIGQILIAVWGLWTCTYLFMSTGDRTGPDLFLLLWLIPFFYSATKSFTRCPIRTTLTFSVMGLLLTLIGTVAQFELPGQLGLIMSLAGLLPCSWRSIVWVLGAGCWVSKTGWLIALTIGPQWTTDVQIFLLVLSYVTLIPSIGKSQPNSIRKAGE